MSNKESFNDKLNKIFNLTESVQPEVIPVVNPSTEEDSVDAFRNLVKTKLREVRGGKPQLTPNQGKPKLGEAPWPDRKEITAKIGVQKSIEEVLIKLAELLNVPRETISTTPNPYPTGETGVFVKVDRRPKNPLHYSHHQDDVFKVSNENIGDVWPVEGGFIFKNHNNPWFAHIVAGGDINENVTVLDERENPISVGTIKSQVQNFGPKALGEIIARLNPEMNKTDANGQPTSDYNQFVDAIKQDGLELILNTSADAGGVKVSPTGGSPQPEKPAPAPDVAKKEPGKELENL